MSVLKFPRFIAIFTDDNGDQVGKKVFSYSAGSLGHKKKTFLYNGGEYNIKPEKSSRLKLSFKTRIIFDDYIYIYKIGNPDPVNFKTGESVPVFEATTYKTFLRNNMIKELIKAAAGKKDINWRRIVIIGVIVGFFIYAYSQGMIPGMEGA